MKTLKRVISFATAIAFTLTSFNSVAGEKLADTLNSMWMSNTTAPSAFNSQTRGGFVGGGVALRSPIRAINLATFDPPRLTAGCGGIDFFGGSFSFINADQLVALFRQVAANAVGVAFKAAIDAINPELGKLMAEFQSKIQSLNENLKNTCAIANSVVKSFSDPEARTENINGVVAAVTSAAGTFTDLFRATSDFMTNPNSAKRAVTVSGDCIECGNPVWKAIVDSNAGQYFGNPDDAVETALDYSNELILSMLGTVIMSSSEPDTSNPGGTVKAQVGQDWKQPILTLMHLRDGARQGMPLKKFTCQDGWGRNQCTVISYSDLNFVGTQGFVNTMLFGTEQGDKGTLDPNSIVGKLTNCTSGKCGFTTNQQMFINSTSVPILGILRQVQQSPGAVSVVAGMLSDVIADEYALSMGNAVVRAATVAVNGSKGLIPENVPSSIAAINQDIVNLRKIVSEKMPKVMAAKQYATIVIANNPSIFAKPGRR